MAKRFPRTKLTFGNFRLRGPAKMVVVAFFGFLYYERVKIDPAAPLGHVFLIYVLPLLVVLILFGITFHVQMKIWLRRRQ